MKVRRPRKNSHAEKLNVKEKLARRKVEVKYFGLEKFSISSYNKSDKCFFFFFFFFFLVLEFRTR